MKNTQEITVQSVSESGVIFAKKEGIKKETVELSWATVFQLGGSSGGFGGPTYPHMMPAGPFADLAIEAMRRARELHVRVMRVAEHPFNQVRVETVSGEFVGQEMGVDWGRQHPFPAAADAEAADLAKLYKNQGFRVIGK